MDKLKDRVVVITGAANGIGRAWAQAFAEAGCRLALADIEGKTVNAFEAELKAARHTAVCAVVDVTRPDQLIALAGLVEERFGGADILVNNAGVALPGRSVEALSPNDWRWVMDVNLMGAVHAIGAFLPQLKASSHAYVVNVASMTAFDAGPYNAPYCASKAALLALSESLALEYEAESLAIGVSVVCPGAVQTTIARSGERRSAAYGAAGPSAEMPPAMRTFLANAAFAAMHPEAIASQVLDAVRNGRFYVVTHPFSDDRILRRGADATSRAGALSRRR